MMAEPFPRIADNTTGTQGMNPESDRIKALHFETPEFVPVSVSMLPAVWMKYREELDALLKRHPILFGKFEGIADYDAVPKTYAEGNHTDPWGCVWTNIRQGMESIVKQHPVPTRQHVHRLKAPDEDVGLPHGFMFLRLTDLRGFTELMIDFAEEPPELQMLIDIVLEYNLRQAKLMLQGLDAPRTLYFGDDLGMQRGLPMGPPLWRKYMKPCFAQLYQPVRHAGHNVYMHTDGWILDIIPDLIECGVSILNPQYRANGLDGLVAQCKGKICINLDLDRQLFPFATPAQLDAHIQEAIAALGSPEGGLWVAAEIGPDVPLENIEAICVSLEKHRKMFS